MRNWADDRSESFLAPAEPDSESELSVLLVVAARMQGESLRYQLASRGFEVELTRSVSSALERLPGASYDALILDWQTLEVEYPVSKRAATWLRLARDVQIGPKPVGMVALMDAMQSAPPKF